MEDFALALAVPDVTAEQRAKALVARGVLYNQLGERQKALDDISTVLAMPDAPPKHRARALANRSWAHYEANQIPEAVDDGRSAVSISPDDWLPHANLGIFLLVQGQVGDALSEYNTALALADTSDLEEMTNDLREAITRYPELPGAVEAMAQIDARIKTLRAIKNQGSA